MDKKPIFSIKDENPIPSFQQEQMMRRPSNKKPVFIIVGVIVAILAIFTIVLAAKVWNPPWNPFKPKPELILLKALQASKEIKTEHADIYFLLDVQAEESFSFEVGIEIDSDNTDKDVPRMSGDFDLSFYMGGIKVPLTGKIKSIGDTQYFRIDSFPLAGILGMLSELGGEAGVDNEEIAAYGAAVGQVIDQLTGQWIRFSPEELGLEIGVLPKEKEEELEQGLEELLVKYPILKGKKTFPDDVIDGNKVYHFLFVLNRENLLPFMEGVTELSTELGLLPEVGESVLADLEQNREEINKQMGELFEKIGEIETEIWIGKKDNLIYKIKGEKIIEASDIEPGEEGRIKMSWDFSFSKFNEPMSIVAPQESISIMDLYMSLMGGFGDLSLLQAPQRAKDARIKSDVTQARTMAALLYADEGSYYELCKDGTLNSDYSQELKVLSEDILEQGSQTVCYTNGVSYCLKAPLIYEAGKMFCVDSTGMAVDTDASACTEYNMICTP